MQEKRTSLFENGLIWFGAAVSIAEIVTGMSFAPLGFAKGFTAIILGHIIGFVLLSLSGIIGGKLRKSSMETTKTSFGSIGSIFFALLNLIQLVGWTAIMIFDGAIAANGIFDMGNAVWCVIIGGLIILWILIGIKNLSVVNTVAMAALFVLTVILSFVVFGGGDVKSEVSESLSFGAALELSIAMPISWLPLISDYTREAEKPVKASFVSAGVYSAVSVWMYVIGMAAAIFTESNDIASIILKSGIGISGLVIIIFSTVTTTFLDAYSAGVSFESIFSKIKGKYIAVITALVGIIAAVTLPLYDITEFLYFIGSVFAPMIAIQIADFFILKKDASRQTLNVTNALIWIIGFVLYRILMNVDIIIGSTVPSMAVTVVLCVITDKIKNLIKGK